MNLAALVLGLAASQSPVLVELYSSEGCSSCPPAEALLRDLVASDSSIVALEFHVDYWNSLGWTDRFSSSTFSDRQSRHTATRGSDQVFTPEAIVDGRTSLVGSDRSALTSALAKARKHAPAALALERTGGEWSVRGEAVPTGQLWVAVTEAGLETTATRGENRGRRLVHAPVVRSFRTLGLIKGGKLELRLPVNLDPAWKQANLRVVAAVEDANDGTILALGSAPIGP